MSFLHMDVAGADVLDRAQKLLAGVKGGADAAIKSAAARSVMHLRTNARKKIREHYDISATNIRADENVRVSYSYQNGVRADIRFAGHKIPLFRYGKASPKQPSWNQSEWVRAVIAGHWRKVHPGRAATGHQFKNTAPTKFHHAFVARMRSGHVGIFERSGSANNAGGDAIQELMGSSVPQMLGNKEVEESLANAAMEKFEERLEHEILYRLNGW